MTDFISAYQLVTRVEGWAKMLKTATGTYPTIESMADEVGRLSPSSAGDVRRATAATIRDYLTSSTRTRSRP